MITINKSLKSMIILFAILLIGSVIVMYLLGWLNPRSSLPGNLSSSLAKVIEISYGSGHICILLSDGSVKCWGENSVGQLGNKIVAEYSTTPVTVVVN